MKMKKTMFLTLNYETLIAIKRFIDMRCVDKVVRDMPFFCNIILKRISMQQPKASEICWKESQSSTLPSISITVNPTPIPSVSYGSLLPYICSISALIFRRFELLFSYVPFLVTRSKILPGRFKPMDLFNVHGHHHCKYYNDFSPIST